MRTTTRFAVAAVVGALGLAAVPSARARPIVTEALGIRTVDPRTGAKLEQLVSRDARQPLWSPNGRMVVFATGYENNTELFVSPRQRGRVRKITHNHQLDQWPSWSPDSKRLVVERFDVTYEEPDNELFVVRADGSGGRRLTDNEVDDLCPDWSPRGGRVVFTRDPGADVYSVRPNGRGLEALTSGTPRDWGPIWSPNGRRILFHTIGREEQSDLVVMDRDGSHRRRLTRTRASEYVCGWSPKGRRIAFLAYQPDGTLSLGVMRADGSHRRRLVSDIGNGHVIPASPTWSAKGQRIAYARETESASGKQRVDIWIVSVDGTSNRRLTKTDDAHEYSPDWFSSPQECATGY